jgi:spore coat protein U-like protein
MKASRIIRSSLLITSLLSPAVGLAASAVSTISVSVTRSLSITNISALEFGSVSVSSTAGTVVIDTDGMRFSTGGVMVDPSGSYTPARFYIEGKPNANFSIKLPNRVEIRDGFGNTISVDNFNTSVESGTLDANGVLEFKVGGQINLDPNQNTGEYSGTMVVELNYS